MSLGIDECDLYLISTPEWTSYDVASDINGEQKDSLTECSVHKEGKFVCFREEEEVTVKEHKIGGRVIQRTTTMPAAKCLKQIREKYGNSRKKIKCKDGTTRTQAEAIIKFLFDMQHDYEKHRGNSNSYTPPRKVWSWRTDKELTWKEKIHLYTRLQIAHAQAKK